MEQCKREGENVNNRDVVNVDRISGLPEALIVKILCLIPTKEAIATSVFSKQWKSQWKMMPKLKFGSFIDRLKIENVCKSLLSHKAPVLQSLHLQIHLNRGTAADIGILIGIAFTRNVRKLVLGVYNLKGSFTFPRCLYNCETLETLKLTVVACIDVPSSVCLKSLRTLHLQCVGFKDDESIGNLLSGCPKLEDLMVHRNTNCTVKKFTIAVPSLQRLSINNGYGREKPWGYVINAPSLKYFKIEGITPLESYLMENVHELVEASIVNVSKIKDDKLMKSVILVKRLSLALSPSEIKFPTDSIFSKLVYLELYTNTLLWWDLLTLMLDTSPILQVLKLIDPESLSNHLYRGAEWNQPKNVPECLLLHLETFMWEGYKWKLEHEIEVAKYILKNANRLKRATFSSVHMRCDSKDRLEVVNDLKSVVWASSSCHFQFNWNKHTY